MKTRSDSKFDPRWIILFVVMTSVITTTIMMNHQYENQSADKNTETIDIDNGDANINWDKLPTSTITLIEDLEITSPGTYHLNGSINDGSISISAGSNDAVKLVLENVEIHNSSGPAIICYSADDLVIELQGENTLEDSSIYSTEYDSDVAGVIYSKSDLTIDGDGSLNIIANYQDGIVSKDDLKIKSGNFNIISNDDGIRGKDSVYIMDGDFSINSTGDSIKSTNENEVTKGFILIENGNFDLTSQAKGLKAIHNIIIRGGHFAIETNDDAIHSNNYVGIVNGAFNIVSNDDAIHADHELIIDNGEINIAKAYEGLEAQEITVNDGKISLVTIDDGINAGGGADASSLGRPGANQFKSDENCILTINGGDLYINASGDGLDSNGWLYFNGGNVIVDGPTDNGNGALDAGISIVTNGGQVLAIGSSGMAESLGSKSSVFSASIYLTQQEPAKTTISIKDSSEETLIVHTSAKAFSHIAVGLKDFNIGETYTLFLNDEKYQSFTLSDIVTTVGNPAPMNGIPQNKRPQ